eukprot:8409779-Pyramimonas_sp.AAC.1
MQSNITQHSDGPARDDEAPHTGDVIYPPPAVEAASPHAGDTTTTTPTFRRTRPAMLPFRTHPRQHNQSTPQTVHHDVTNHAAHPSDD